MKAQLGRLRIVVMLVEMRSIASTHRELGAKEQMIDTCGKGADMRRREFKSVPDFVQAEASFRESRSHLKTVSVGFRMIMSGWILAHEQQRIGQRPPRTGGERGRQNT